MTGGHLAQLDGLEGGADGLQRQRELRRNLILLLRDMHSEACGDLMQ